MRCFRSILVVFAGVALGTLAACAGIAIQQSTMKPVPADEGRIVFAAESLRGGTSRHVAWVDAWEYEEYALFRGNGAQAEAVYMEVTEDQWALKTPYWLATIRQQADTWNFNRDRPKRWGESGRVSLEDLPQDRRFLMRILGKVGARPLPVPIFYRPYTRSDVNRSCFAFSTYWDIRGEDPQTRPTKFLFGYYCASAGESLTRRRIEELAMRLGVRRAPERAAERLSATPEEMAEAKALVRGTATAGATGTQEFPFALAIMYGYGSGNGNGGMN